MTTDDGDGIHVYDAKADEEAAPDSLQMAAKLAMRPVASIVTPRQACFGCNIKDPHFIVSNFDGR